MVTKLDHIVSLVQQAQTTLSFQDNQKQFPKLYQPIFTASSTDVAIDFGIEGVDLVATVNLLNIAEVNPIEHALNQLKSVKTVKLHGKDIEVVETIVVKTCLPMLTDLGYGLGKIEELCADFIRKYNVLY
jgi:hypothetical protein